MSHSVTLNWDVSTNAAAYNIYRATTSGGSYTKVNSVPVIDPTYEDTAVQAGLTYFYVVTAVDSSGQESGYSTEVQGKVPTP
jgi:fibronectin type 3 domain-containing protein